MHVDKRPMKAMNEPSLEAEHSAVLDVAHGIPVALTLNRSKSTSLSALGLRAVRPCIDQGSITDVMRKISTTLADDLTASLVGVLNVAGFCMISPMEFNAREDMTLQTY
ncbi:hypothetical protein DAEQUDRAFT_726531, partial [Daedalea quercina L-15889]